MSYSPIDLWYGTRSTAWWTSHVAFSLNQYGIIRHGCLFGTTSTWFPVLRYYHWYHKSQVEYDKRLRWKVIISNLFSTLSQENRFMVTMMPKRLADESVYDTHQQRPVLLQRSDAVASLSSNGSTAFKESCALIGYNSCNSVMSH